MRLDEVGVIPAPEDGEGAEEAAEEQDLRHQEEPDAHSPGVELHVGVVEMVGDVEALASLGVRAGGLGGSGAHDCLPENS